MANKIDGAVIKVSDKFRILVIESTLKSVNIVQFDDETNQYSNIYVPESFRNELAEAIKLE